MKKLFSIAAVVMLAAIPASAHDPDPAELMVGIGQQFETLYPYPCNEWHPPLIYPQMCYEPEPEQD